MTREQLLEQLITERFTYHQRTNPSPPPATHITQMLMDCDLKDDDISTRQRRRELEDAS